MNKNSLEKNKNKKLFEILNSQNPNVVNIKHLKTAGQEQQLKN